MQPQERRKKIDSSAQRVSHSVHVNLTKQRKIQQITSLLKLIQTNELSVHL